MGVLCRPFHLIKPVPSEYLLQSHTSHRPRALPDLRDGRIPWSWDPPGKRRLQPLRDALRKLSVPAVRRTVNMTDSAKRLHHSTPLNPHQEILSHLPPAITACLAHLHLQI